MHAVIGFVGFDKKHTQNFKAKMGLQQRIVT